MTDPCWWHYTLGTTLFEIIADQQIKRARVGMYHGERRAVWFSCRPTWEPSATRGHLTPGGLRRPATMPEMVMSGGALVRLRVSERVARHTWAAHRKLGGLDARVADALEWAARERGASPDEWRASYHDVPLRNVLSVDQSTDGEIWTAAGGTYSDVDGGGLDLDPTLVERIRMALGIKE